MKLKKRLFATFLAASAYINVVWSYPLPIISECKESISGEIREGILLWIYKI